MTSRSTRCVLAVVACLALTAAACGRDDKASTTTTTPSGGTKNASFIDPSSDCTNYQGTEGIKGDTITIGTVYPASGPYAIYSPVTTGIEKFFAAANAKGGIKAGNGKSYKVNLLKEDDGYDPSRTPDAVKKLVEQEHVFALVGDIGTETNLAVRQYLNDACVPDISLATGSTEWGQAAKFPWYIAGLPSYATEADAFMDYLASKKPDATIALLKQNDDFGEGYAKAIEKYIAAHGNKMKIVGQQSYNPSSGQTAQAATVALAGTKADAFFVGIGGAQCPQALTFIPSDWKPMTYVSITCSGKTALSLAGGHDEGVFTTQATLDPGAPSDQSNPKVQQFLTDGAAQGVSQADLQGGIVAAGWGFASIFAEGLAQTKDVSRAGIMNALFSLDKSNFGLMRDGAEASTDGAKDPWIIESLRVVQRTNGDWTEVQPLTDYNGKSNSLAG
jgi:branched-chain amino acid transport system substrate-binding protein